MKKEPTTAQQESALEDALSPIVNKLIDKNYENSQDKIVTQMAPLMGKAIREQIKSQKDDVVDALYPVIGNMISRYVTKSLEDMLHAINTQIQNGLSFKTLKRKITAKIQGVSETELLLKENASANIRALLLIHKETGIVLAHSENPSYPVSEPEMLASMMSAIRSFINDWVHQNGSDKELGEIEYGGNKIILEASGYSYLAVIVEGAAYKTTYDKIRTTMEHIVLHHGESIRNFQGDLSSFGNLEIYKEISLLLNNSNTPKNQKKKLHPLLFLFPLILLLLGGYAYYKHYLNTVLSTNVNSKLYATPQLTLYRLNAINNDGIITLRGEVPFVYYKQLAQNVVQNIEGVHLVKNEIVVVKSLNDPFQISSDVSYLLNGLNQDDGINLRYTYDYNKLFIEGSVWDETRKREVLKKLQTINANVNINENIQILPPLLDATLYFEKGLTSLTDEARKTLVEAITLLKRIDNNTSICLTSYSDMIGSPEQNQKLSEQRLKNSATYLKEIGAISKKMVFESSPTPPAGIDYKEEPQKARCIKITYKQEKPDDKL